MPITQIVGLMGFGKSYEATNFVALRHFAEGRRIVSNVRGLNEEKYQENWRTRAQREFPKLPGNGTILHVTPQQVRAPDFFPDPENDELPSVVKAGDVVVLDELGAIWPAGAKPSAREIRFLTQHRHFDDPVTGWTIEILVLYQAEKLVPGVIKDLAQTTIAVRKHLAFGSLGKRRYVTNVFIGSEIKGKSMATVQRRIDAKLPPLYSPTRHGIAREVDLDDRHSRKTKRVVILMLGALLFLPAMSWVLLRHFHSMASGPVHAQVGPGVASVVGSSLGAAAGAVVPVAAPPKPVGPFPSARWRVVGFVRSPVRYVVILSDQAGAVRVVPAGLFQFAGGQPVSGLVDGELVTDATGLPMGAPAGLASLGGGR